MIDPLAESLSKRLREVWFGIKGGLRMIRKERAAHVDEELDRLYPNPPIPLDHKDPYTLLVAVLLSAQCTDVRVNKTTPSLWVLADNPFDMAEVAASRIENVVRPCGLAPRKAQAIHDLSNVLVENYDGEVPEDFDALESLAGVGHKTASVVMAQAFGHPAFPVDTHIHRLAQRWGLTNGKNVTQTEKDLKKLFPEERWNDLHLQIIYFGREYCTARGCDGTVCPMCRALYPRRKKAVVARK